VGDQAQVVVEQQVPITAGGKGKFVASEYEPARA
jgi:hypothetical protein